MHATSPSELNDPEFDPDLPVAYPVTGVTNLMGEMPVRVRAEGECLVAYGFGGQQVAIPRAMISRLMVHWLRTAKGERRNPSLLVHSRDRGRLLLRIRGTWGPGLDEVCAALRLGPPEFRGTSALGSRPLLTRAHGYRSIRVRPRGYGVARFVSVLALLAVLGFAAAGGVALALLLPPAVGDGRDLIAIVLAVGCVTAALWSITYLWRLLRGGLRWAVASRRAAAPAPPGRFLRVTGASTWTRVLPTMTVVLAIPTLLIWAIVIESVTLAHGVRDQALVSELRGHGVTVTGTVIDVPYLVLDSDGNPVLRDRAELDFTTATGDGESVQDPAIAGRTWPTSPHAPVRITYDPADPDKAAAAGQVAGSPWAGAPTGNIVAGIVAITSVPPLTWVAIRRLTASRRKARDEAVEGLA